VTDGHADNPAEGRPATTAESRPGTGSGEQLARVTAVLVQLRVMLGEVTGRDDLLGIPPETALFGGGVGLDSLAGTLLLRRVERRYGVDVAAEDLNLDALETLGTLAAFIGDRI
jgi:acyl carrier protein